MNLSELLGVKDLLEADDEESILKIEKLSEAQLQEIFKDYLKITRPEEGRVEKKSSVVKTPQMKQMDAAKNAKLEKLKAFYKSQYGEELKIY